MSGSRIPYSDKVRIKRMTTEAAKTFGGHLPNEVTRSIASQFKVSFPAVRRIWTNPICEAPKRVTLARVDKVAIARHHGNLKKAWKQRSSEGLDLSYAAFVDRFHALEPLEQIGLTEGAQNAAWKALSAKQEIDHPNDRWHFDHTEADVYVVHNNQVGRPWITLNVDAFSKLKLPPVVTFGVGIGGVPATEGIRALLLGAMIGFEGPDGYRYGGIPRSLFYDNALPHLAEPITNGCAAFSVSAHAITRASPWQNGKAEAAVKGTTADFIAGLPGYLHGLPDRWGAPVSAKVTEKDMWPLRIFSAGLDEYIRVWNFERQGADGFTPAERWQRNACEVEFADPDKFRHLFLSNPERRKVDGYGISFRSIDYTHPALNKHRGNFVEIRYLPNNPDFIDCYSEDGEFICSAVPHEKLTVGQRAALRRYKEAIGSRVTTFVKEGATQARAAAKAEHDRLAVIAGIQSSTEPDEEDEYLQELETTFMGQVPREENT